MIRLKLVGEHNLWRAVIVALEGRLDEVRLPPETELILAHAMIAVAAGRWDGWRNDVATSVADRRRAVSTRGIVTYLTKCCAVIATSDLREAVHADWVDMAMTLRGRTALAVAKPIADVVGRAALRPDVEVLHIVLVENSHIIRVHASRLGVPKLRADHDVRVVRRWGFEQIFVDVQDRGNVCTDRRDHRRAVPYVLFLGGPEDEAACVGSERHAVHVHATSGSVV